MCQNMAPSCMSVLKIASPGADFGCDYLFCILEYNSNDSVLAVPHSSHVLSCTVHKPQLSRRCNVSI